MKSKGGGKRKGSEFERNICKQLSLWVSGGKQQDLFWRSAMSGGRATVARAKGVSVRQSGDITSVAPEGHALTDKFYIECKHYRDLGISSFLLKGTGTLRNFWLQTQKEAFSYRKSPLLIARENGLPIIALVRSGTVRRAYGTPRAYLRWGVGDGAELWLLDELLQIQANILLARPPAEPREFPSRFS